MPYPNRDVRYSVQKTIYVTKEMWLQLKKESKKQEVSMNQFVMDSILSRVGKNEKIKIE